MSLPILVSCIPVLSNTQGYLAGHGVHCGSRNPHDCRCPRCVTTNGTRSTTECVIVL